MDEKQRRISRILTIDEIINPPGRQTPPALGVHGKNSPLAVATSSNGGAAGGRTGGGRATTTTISVTEVENVTGNPNFLRINHSQVVYKPPTSGSGADEPGFSGNTPRRKNVSFASTTSTAPSVSVYREQYWSWSCACRNWTKRERMLLFAVGVLGCVILGLVAFISVYAKNHQLPSISDAWLGWTL